MLLPCFWSPRTAVVPHAGTWIEMKEAGSTYVTSWVVPHAGTWIEITITKVPQQEMRSFPTRERGLKSLWALFSPFAKKVVPHAGTWIEITKTTEILTRKESFPTRERGLKLLIVS